MKRRKVAVLFLAAVGVTAIAVGVYKLIRKKFDDDLDDYDDYDEWDEEDFELEDDDLYDDERSYITVPSSSVNTSGEVEYIQPVLAEDDNDEELKAAAEEFAEDFYSEIFD